jgi:hypothetical protein
MAQEIIDANTFSVDNLSVTPQKPMTGGGKMSFINYKRKGIYIQLPSIVLPQGLSCFTDEKTGKEQYSLQLNLRDYDKDGKMKRTYEMLQALDTYMVDQGVKNSKDWFGLAKNGKELSRDAIEEKYTPCTKFSNDKETGDVAKDKNGNPYPPKFRLKLKQDDNGKFLFSNVINKKKEFLGDRDLKEVFKAGTKITCLIKASMIWFTTAGYGITWKPEQIRIDEEGAQAIAPPTMQDDEDDDGVVAQPKSTGGSTGAHAGASANNIVSDDEEELAQPAKPVATKPSAVSAVIAAADDSDSDEDDTIQAPPVPKKAATLPPKKIIPKKK